jgi:protoporphyrinogen oxidase
MGAGPAGLTAAYELLTRTDIRPIIIEADKQVGGISKTVNYKGNLIDIGGHRFFSKSKMIIDWWLHFLPLETTDDPFIKINYQNSSKEISINQGPGLKKSGAMLIRPRKSRIYYQQDFFDYPLRLNKRTLKNLGFWKTVKLGMYYLNARVFPIKPEENLAQFFRNKFGNELYQTFFKDYTEKVWGVPCEEIPADWGRQRVKDLNIGKAIKHAIGSIFSKNTSITQEGTSTSLIEQFLYPEKGPGQMWETVAEEIIALGGEIRLYTRVCAITANHDNNITSVNCVNAITGEEYELNGDHFFSTIPIKELVRNMRNIETNSAISAIANGLQYRDFIIVGLLLKKLEVKGQGKEEMISDNWIYLQDKGIAAGRLQIFNNWSPMMVKDNENIWMGVEYFCNDSDAFWNESDGSIAKKAIEEMEKIGLINGSDVLDTTVIKVPKAYPSYAGVYRDFKTLQEYLDKFENLFLLGRNGMHRYNNSDHSMMTAITAVSNIIEGRKDKSNIWAVNLEDDYHEET